MKKKCTDAYDSATDAVVATIAAVQCALYSFH